MRRSLHGRRQPAQRGAPDGVEPGHHRGSRSTGEGALRSFRKASDGWSFLPPFLDLPAAAQRGRIIRLGTSRRLPEPVNRHPGDVNVRP